MLGLMRVESLEEAVSVVNSSDFGLTSGIQSLDKREIDYWRENIEVGNAYINRAIVERQPFGGWKKSAFGIGAKAGGSNYVWSLGEWSGSGVSQVADLSDDVKQLLATYPDSESFKDVAGSYAHAYNNHFAVNHDPSQILGESNIFRYRKLDKVLLRVHQDDALEDVLKVALATQTCGVQLEISVSETCNLEFNNGAMNVTVESDAVFIQRLSTLENSRLRILSEVDNAILMAAQEQHIQVIDQPVLDNGRLELRHYLLEQAVSETVHRYGNLTI